MKSFEPIVSKPEDQRPMTEIYQAKVDTYGYSDVEVRIIKMDNNGRSKEVYAYERNYAFMDTFAPFRQYKNGEWKDYALLSTDYDRLEVLDIAQQKIIASQQYMLMTDEQWASLSEQEQQGAYRNSHPGEELPGVSFCPVDFYVPEYESADSLFNTINYLQGRDVSQQEKDLQVQKVLERFHWVSTGQWGLYAGTAWGDDGYYKIRHIDLSSISEGIVKTDERYGYLEMPNNTRRLHEVVSLSVNPAMVSINTPIHFRADGTVRPGYHALSGTKAHFVEV